MTRRRDGRLEGRRVDDPPPKQPLRFRLALAIRKYPVHFGVLLALVLLAIPVSLVVVEVVKNRNLVASIQRQRAETTAVFCHALNNVGSVNQRQNAVLGGILVSSVKQGRIYRPVLHKLGVPLPPYAQQLKQAKQFQDQLNQTQPPPVNCAKLRRQIEENLR